jgi:anti-sigma28 factor (negative regulator of flagellin synthesis)
MKFEIKGISGVMTAINNAVPVLIDSAGQLGTINSSRRYKEDIDNMARASDNLLTLRPVIFRYKKAIEDGDIPIQNGLIAEEVAEVFPALVVYNEHGEPETVKYHLLATLLLNELQKQRSEIQTLQQVTVDQATHLVVSLVEQSRSHESEQERLVALEAKVAELTALTALLTQSVTPVSEVQLASN